MRVLLIYKHPPDLPADFYWSALLGKLHSQGHEVRCAWHVLPSLPEKLEQELTQGVMTVAEFVGFGPDLVLFDGRPQPQQPLHGTRRLPWELEQTFLAEGGALVFMGAEGDFNDARANQGFIEYGFPLALSGSEDPKCRWGGNPAFLASPINGPVKIECINLARSVLGHPSSESDIGLVQIERPFVLDDSASSGQTILYAPDGYNAKDPVWRYEGEMRNIRKPYAIAAYQQRGGSIWLFTGNLFSDFTIDKANNADLFNSVVDVIRQLHDRKRLMTARPTTVVIDNSDHGKSETASSWDFFIAYSSLDGNTADHLYSALSAYGRVFLDRRCMRPGDIWPQRLRREQNQSRSTVLLITEHTVQAWFTNSEYIHAIGLARSGKHRLIPVLIGKETQAPYGMEQIHAVHHQDADFTSTASQIAEAVLS